MDIALNLLKAPHVGVREFKEKVSSFLNKRKTLVVTDHGDPASVLVPYKDMMEILDILENTPKSVTGSSHLEALLTSESSLKKDWDSPKEDKAWQSL